MLLVLCKKKIDEKFLGRFSGEIRIIRWLVACDGILLKDFCFVEKCLVWW